MKKNDTLVPKGGGSKGSRFDGQTWGSENKVIFAQKPIPFLFRQ